LPDPKEKQYYYRIILKCQNDKDEDNYGRDLKMNNYEAAVKTYKNLLDAAYENLIDPYTVTLYQDDKIIREFGKY